MNARKIVATLLIVAGVAALLFGGFSYTRETHEAEMGPIQLQLEEREHVSLPPWLGVGAIAAGTLLLLNIRLPKK